jgi:hypothetical protein
MYKDVKPEGLIYRESPEQLPFSNDILIKDIIR